MDYPGRTLYSSMEYKLKKMLGKKFRCKCGRVHFVPTKEIYAGLNAKERLVRFILKEGLGANALIVSDQNTFAAAGESLSEYLAENGFKTGIEIFVSRKEKLKAEKELALSLAKRLKKRADFAVAVGSGTINDLVKYAATVAGIPYISYPTAASMNGYPSSVSALSCRGIKKTLPANPPVAVFADSRILCSAPKEMRLAGLGDGISKSVCNIDWAISRLVKKEYFCALPGSLMKDVMEFYIRNAKRIASGNPQAIKGLFTCLNLAGISMVIAGSSAPASGGEHLISHFLDMMNSKRGRELNLHGVQVGIATVLTAKLYEELLNLDISRLSIEELKKHYLRGNLPRKWFYKFYGREMGGEVYREFIKKYPAWSGKEKEILFILKNWSRIRQSIKNALIPGSLLEKILQDAGHPVSFSRLGISQKDLKDALLHARELRARYTVLDLAFDLGILEDFADRYLRNRIKLRG